MHAPFKNVFLKRFPLAITLLVLGLMACSRGRSEFQAADKAVAKVSSWRMNVTTSYGAKLKIEAIPPDKLHIWQERPSHGQILLLECIHIGHDTYIRGNDPSAPSATVWARVAPSQVMIEPTAPLFGMQDPWHLPTNLAEMMDLSDLRDQGKKNYDGNECTEWGAKRIAYEGSSSPYEDTVCLGITDHLPDHVHFANIGADATYEWYAPVTIEAPDMSEK